MSNIINPSIKLVTCGCCAKDFLARSEGLLKLIEFKRKKISIELIRGKIGQKWFCEKCYKKVLPKVKNTHVNDNRIIKNLSKIPKKGVLFDIKFV